MDAVEPSEAMLRIARSMPGADSGRIRWINEPAETCEFDGPYSLVVAAQSLHWMDWTVVLPKIWSSLRPDGFLAILNRCDFLDMPWIADVMEIIPHYSTNVDYEPYDLIAELETRELFREAGRLTTSPIDFEQSVEEYVDSNHSRNGLSRDRLATELSQEFDDRVRQIVSGYSHDGRLTGRVQFTLTWGTAVE